MFSACVNCTDTSSANTAVSVDCNSQAIIPGDGTRPKPTTPPPRQGDTGDTGSTGPTVDLILCHSFIHSYSFNRQVDITQQQTDREKPITLYS